MHDELHTVKVSIGPTWARYVGEKIWHESQQIKKLSDGSVEMKQISVVQGQWVNEGDTLVVLDRPEVEVR